MVNFFARLAETAHSHDSYLCVGLDPDPSLMPVGMDVAGFCSAIIDATADLVCAYKPNLAFFEAFGPDGLAALRQVVEHIHTKGLLAIADAKRGDIANTARFYARALFDVYGFDAATVNPYLGGDSLEPFIEYADRGLFILCRTSNPGGADIQGLTVSPQGQPLYEIVAGLARQWNRRGNVGLVIGATFPEEAARIRQICPDFWFLLPGVGAQAADLKQAVSSAIDDRGSGFIVNASRQVIYASSADDFASAARQTADRLRQQINHHRRELVPSLR